MNNIKKTIMRYKIYGDCDLAYHQEYTYVDITPYRGSPQVWNFIQETLYERFEEYAVTVDHVSRTVRIEVDNS